MSAKELNIGDYVRTPNGIAQIIDMELDIDNKKYIYTLDRKIIRWYEDLVDNCYKEELEELIIKSSPNIIDLIEVGDFITLGENYFPLMVEELWIFSEKEINIELNNGATFENIRYDKNFKIYSIVTKEQFEAIKYKIGE